MVLQSRLLLLAAAFLGSSLAADDKTPTATACTAISTKGGSFFDLRPDIAVAPKKDGKSKRGPSADYEVKGYDYGYNFTLNICEAVINTPQEVVGIESSLYKNISAYYKTEKGDVFSLG